MYHNASFGAGAPERSDAQGAFAARRRLLWRLSYEG